MTLPARSSTAWGAGEIELSGAQVFTGYHRNDAATAQSLVDGRLRTGEIGRRDEEGYYTSSAAARTPG